MSRTCVAPSVVASRLRAPRARPARPQPDVVARRHLQASRTSSRASGRSSRSAPSRRRASIRGCSAPQTLPPGVTFDPPTARSSRRARRCRRAQGQHGRRRPRRATGNRFIAIAVETSEAVPIHRSRATTARRSRSPGPGCAVSSRSVEAPAIDGAQHAGHPPRSCRRPSTASPRSGELYNYVASFGTFLVIVTANPLVLPDSPSRRSTRSGPATC